ncbi:MAG: hypothetical protein QXT63_06770 [Thermoplasmata archaeon]
MGINFKRWGRLGHSRLGIAGFFEDIPALMVVTIGLAIFIIIVLSVYSNYYTTQVYVKIREDGESFSKAVRSYEGLKSEYWNRDGFFDAKKLMNITAENISRDLHPGYKFSIEIEDVSSYPTKYERKGENAIVSGKDYQKTTKVSVTSGANIFVSDTEIHCARLRVSIWGRA